MFQQLNVLLYKQSCLQTLPAGAHTVWTAPLCSSSQVIKEPWHHRRRHLHSGGFSNMWRTVVFEYMMVWWYKMPPTLLERVTAFVTRPTGPTCMKNTRRKDGRKKASRGRKHQTLSWNHVVFCNLIWAFFNPIMPNEPPGTQSNTNDPLFADFQQ